jgi:hypothetical protein
MVNISHPGRNISFLKLIAYTRLCSNKFEIDGFDGDEASPVSSLKVKTPVLLLVFFYDKL